MNNQLYTQIGFILSVIVGLISIYNFFTKDVKNKMVIIISILCILVVVGWVLLPHSTKVEESVVQQVMSSEDSNKDQPMESLTMNATKENKADTREIVIASTKKMSMNDLLINFQKDATHTEFSIYDLQNDVVYKSEFSGGKQEAAGLIYIPIMLTYFDIERDNSGFMEQLIEIQFYSGGTGILKNSDIGRLYSIKDLVRIMVKNSDNTAANHLIDFLGGFDVINNHMNEIGCSETRINRKLADTQAIKRGIENYTSVNDMLFILKDIYRGGDQLSSEMLSYMNKNDQKGLDLTRTIDESVSVYHQTGTLDRVFNDAGIISTKEKSMIIITFTSRIPSVDGERITANLARDIIKLIQSH